MCEMEKIKLDCVLIVEGKYDKIKLSSFVDGLILQTDGFRIFKSPQKRAMIRQLAEACGLIILTDSDVAGMKIRNYITSIVKNATIHHVYIPQIKGTERRKTAPSKEGTLGVEGMSISLLRALFIEQGVLTDTHLPAQIESSCAGSHITKQQLFADGYIGAPHSTRRRKALMTHLDLPPILSTKALVRVVCSMMTREEYRIATDKINQMF